MTYSNTLGFYTTKIISIFIISIIYFIIGYFSSIILNDLLPEKDNIQQLSTFHLILLISTLFGIIGILYYFLRIAIKNMPFFLDSVYGFKYSLLRETSGGIIFAFILYTYLDKLQILLQELQYRIYKKNRMNISVCY